MTTPTSKTVTSTEAFDVARAKSGVIVGLPAAMIAAVKAQRTTDKLSVGTSKAMLEVAKTLQSRGSIGKHSEKDTASGKFDAACKEQETFIRSREAKSYRVDNLPRYWSNPKSQIRAALNFGIDLALYQTESKLRKAVALERAKLKGGDVLGDMLKALKKECENVSEDIFSEAIKQARGYITAQVLLKGVVLDKKAANTTKEGAPASADSIAKLVATSA